MSAVVVELDWEVTHKHTVTMTVEDLQQIATDLHIDVDDDATDDDLANAVHDALQFGDWRAEELLHEMANRNNWLDDGTASLTDLRLLDEPDEEAAS